MSVAVVTIIAYSASAGMAFGGRALAAPSPPVDGQPSPSASPPEAGTTEPSFSVDASSETGRPGDLVKVAFAVNDTGWAIDGCTARFADDAPTVCGFDAALDASADLTVPPGALPGSVPINWTISYHALPKESGGSSLGTQGSSSFVVLPPVSKVVSPSPDDPAGGGGPLVTEPPDGVVPVERPRTVPSSNNGSLPIGVPLVLVVLAAGGIAVALISGRKRAGSLVAAGPPPGGDEVRVVPHFESGIRVTVREAHRSLTNVVRLEPHSGVPMVDVEERK
ncbi:hypothetical protein [Actinoallomurus bryophytorum]|uniref:hypothetical protein n=1 Tax=Actinoallomurus bryophytorum TaxID=1490222 RepID=UPI00114E9C03|nr:hypothetical protein [Actinoallomurus bryophytorum]